MYIPMHLSAQDNALKERIIEAVCTYCGIHRQQLYLRSKSPRVSYPRQLVVYLLMRYTTITPPLIALCIGSLCRSSVYKCWHTIKDRLSVEQRVQQDIFFLTSKINSDVPLTPQSRTATLHALDIQ